MFLHDHFLKWALSTTLVANVAEAEHEIYSSEEDTKDLEVEDSEESFVKDTQSADKKPIRRKTRSSSRRT